MLTTCGWSRSRSAVAISPWFHWRKPTRLRCTPPPRSSSSTRTTERAEPLVHKLREAHPKTPIVLVENISYQAGWLLPATRNSYTSKNEALRQAFARLAAAGIPNLYYVPGADLFGNDAEATVDGTHATDLGFWRMAQVLEPVLRQVLGQ